MKVKLIRVRLSFPDLFVPVQFDGKGEFRYGATFLMEKGSDNHKSISAAIRAAATEGWKSKADAMIESLKGNSNKFCLQDGDLNPKGYEGYAGNMVLSARRKQKDGMPYLCDENKVQLTTDTGKLYSGCYVNATVDVWAQVKDYPGIRCTLLGVQFAGDGDAFSGGAARPDPDDFDMAEGAAASSLV
mgnify:CR=1 FL=1